jgi:bacteriophage N4 adsorption protein B
VAACVLWISIPVALYLILSGADDLVIDLLWIVQRIRGFTATPDPAALDHVIPQRLAIFVPLWHEHQVIEQMLVHNHAAIHYPDYQFFVGVYPNDQATIDAVRRASERLSNVTLCMVPHPGPTSKPDCLNAIYQGMLSFEARTGTRFSMIVTHDAEDVIHPQSLRWINYYAQDYDFVQIPVLALKTPLLSLTHGVYCDEFAETHGRDLAVRAACAAFVPSAGVGTGYSRRALESLAAANSGEIFIPDALTEDYENGLRLHQMGFRQVFVPIARSQEDGFVATREYFPQSFSTAIRQRTRWVIGISLQSWKRNGWRGGWWTRYWLWRDRKGLIGAPIGLLTNLLSALGVVSQVWRQPIPSAVLGLFAVTTMLGILRIGIRIWFVFRIYGPGMALTVPLRILWGNAINALATLRAEHRFVKSLITGSALSWSKTAHEYPGRDQLAARSRKLGEILVSMHGISSKTIDHALRTKPAIVRLGEYLLDHCQITEEQLYSALAIQQQLPLANPEPGSIPNRVRRAFPSNLMHRWNVLPFAMDEAGLHVCSPEPPAAELLTQLHAHTSMPVHFHLVPPSKYVELTHEPAASQRFGVEIDHRQPA